MAKKKPHKQSKSNDGGLVYSTDQSTMDNALAEQLAKLKAQDEKSRVPVKKQDLRITLDKKLKGGKVATVITGFVGPEEDLVALGKTLKAACGVGGTAKEGRIILQGAHLDKVQAVLKKEGYRFKLAGI